MNISLRCAHGLRTIRRVIISSAVNLFVMWCNYGTVLQVSLAVGVKIWFFTTVFNISEVDCFSVMCLLRKFCQEFLRIFFCSGLFSKLLRCLLVVLLSLYSFTLYAFLFSSFLFSVCSASIKALLLWICTNFEKAKLFCPFYQLFCASLPFDLIPCARLYFHLMLFWLFYLYICCIICFYLITNMKAMNECQVIHSIRTSQIGRDTVFSR